MPGAVSLMVTVVPASAVALVCLCTQKVSPEGARYWCTMVWPDPMVRETAPSQSFPAPKTHEFALVVTNDAFGAPERELPLPVAPIAPEPFWPDGSAPLNDITVIEAEGMLWFNVAVTVAPVNTDGANARQISDVPHCTLVRTTSCHVSAPPVLLTPATVVVGPVEVGVGAVTNASNSSFAAEVENDGEVIEAALLSESREISASTASAAEGTTLLEALDAGPAPTAFVAVTAKV